MKTASPIHPDFGFLPEHKEQGLIELFSDLRSYILELCYSIIRMRSRRCSPSPISFPMPFACCPSILKALIKEAIDFAVKDMAKPTKVKGTTISKIKKG